MPGRQAHGRPLLADPNKKRKGNKKSGGNGGGAGGPRASGAPSGARSSGGAPRTRQGGRVDVMALAEQQVGESRAKGVRVRDLEIERDQTKRRRGDDDDDEDEDDDEEEAPKRRRPNNDNDDASDGSSNEIHSDSSGNEWREGVGSDDDDSEIDSDEAFGDSDDDEIFDAFAFKGSKSKQNKNKKAKSKSKKAEKFDDPDDFGGFDDDSEDNYSDEDVGDDGADLGDEAIDLAAALDIVSSDEEEEAASSSKKDKSRKKKKQQQQTEDSDMFASDASDASDISGSGSDDSGSDELSSTDSSEYDSDDEEDDEEDDEAVLGKSDALQSIASAYAAGQNGDSDDDDSDADAANNSTNPYQFNASLGSKDKSLKKSIKAAVGASSDKKLDVPLLPMQQDQQLRVAAAEKANETLDRWTETVKQNRRAEHLSFEVAGSIATSGLDTATLLPINHKSAQTDLEKTILSIMEESGLGPQAQAEERAQQKQLERQKAEEELSPDALKAIIGQKRRARELQSREQARAKRIKKIKSKAYRRVHRRERQRAEEALEASDAEHDDDEDQDSEAERDAAHRRRALERMGARHRDSKWAKRAKNTNRAAWDDEFRAGLVDMARQDEELRRRVDGAGVGGRRVAKNGEAEESDSDSFGEESDEEAFKLRTKQKLAAAGGKGGDDDEPKGLMGIAFMRKAEEARKKANDEAVAEIMRDLDRGDDSDEDMIDFDVDGANGGDDDEDAADKAVGRRSYGPVAGQKGPANDEAAHGPTRQERRRQAAAEREAAAAAAASEKPSHAADVSNTYPARTASAPGDAGSWTVVAKSGSSSKDKKAKKNGVDSDTTPGLTADGRLVMSAVVDDVLAQNKAAENTTSAKEVAAAKKAAAAAARAKQATNGTAGYDSETSSSGSDSEDDVDTRGNANRSKHFRFRAENEQLLRKALGEDGAAAEFAAEKVRQAAEEAAAWEEEQARVSGKKNKNSDLMPGWGSWVGDGVSKRAIKRDQRATRTPGGKKDTKTKEVVRRDAKSDKVIISERRVHKNEKYLASQLPHEFETRNQYERSLRLPVGPEWSTTFAFQDATKPRILQKQGVVLPMAKPQL
ncbi:hypothetical protein Sste5346_004906 [Sporothrix stenoceras]|uniref:Uncharacterized protein n=1 Tax=Sporothrix stenoceras TaxID=5173 RepID=A0ABR3Z6I3_9PEZI